MSTITIAINAIASKIRNVADSRSVPNMIGTGPISKIPPPLARSAPFFPDKIIRVTAASASNIPAIVNPNPISNIRSVKFFDD